ncbi:MAG: glycosyltransferase family 4 protein [Desulfobaccales bacterium]
MRANPPKHVAVMGIKGLPAKGGGERVAEVIIDAALANDYRVTVYAKKSYLKETNLPKNLEIIPIHDLPGKHLSAFSFGLASAFHALFRRNYDLIHLHYADFGYIVPLLRLRYKVLGTSHGAEYHRDKWGSMAKWCFQLFEMPFVRLTNACTSVSKSLAEYYSRKYGKDVLYIPNGINPYQARGVNLSKKKYRLPPGYILFCAGRIIPSKGCDLLLEANRRLGLKVPVVVIGDMEGDVAYKKYLLELAEPNIVFLNFISSKDELFELIRNCRFFVFPSIYEAMSMILLEVASLKKGLVCSDIPENVEAIGPHAVYFASANISDLQEKLEYALRYPEKMTQMAEASYSWVMQHRQWQEITKSYLELYAGL